MSETWTNWSGSVTCTPASIESPSRYEELSAIVTQAAREGRRVRVAGSGHSFSPVCATDGLLVSLDNVHGVIETDADARRARVRAGTKLHALGQPLLRAGMALEQQGDIDRQSLGGVLGTGTHGTGFDFRNMSNQAVALTLITASGDLVECSENANGEVLRAALVSLGALGIIVDAELQCVAPYRLHERSWTLPFEDALTQFDELSRRNRHCEFFYQKEPDFCLMKTLSLTDEQGGTDLPEDERIGWSHQVFPSERDRKFNEMEFSIPAESGLECIREVRDVIRRHDGVRWPIEYRTVKGDDIPLSPHFGRDSVTISVHQSYRREHEPYFRDCEAVFRNFGGRPHWGKIHYMSHREIAALYPHWDRFQRVRDWLDPNRMFANPYVDRVLG